MAEMGNKDTYPMLDQWGKVSLKTDKKMVVKIKGILTNNSRFRLDRFK
jgi:hypothetical protein